MRVLIATVHVPFIQGGAELHATGLRDAIRREGHDCEIAAVPFRGHPADAVLKSMLACRFFDTTSYMGVPVDVLVALKFPAYLISHPNKVTWILHQHRQVYELWDDPLASDVINEPDGLGVRDLIRNADSRALRGGQPVFATSQNVSRRLTTSNGVEAPPLYHPPPRAESFFSAATGDYFFCPSRINRMKRQRLVIEALAQARCPAQVHFAGRQDHSRELTELHQLASTLGVEKQVQWLGCISEGEKRRQYANSLAVIYPPRDEDYGYVTLEAMLSRKAVITCADSGGPLEFVEPEETGLVVDPSPAGLAQAIERLWTDRETARRWGEQGFARYQSMEISWPRVVTTLLSAARSS